MIRPGDQERVPVGRGLGDTGGRDIAPGARPTMTGTPAEVEIKVDKVRGTMSGRPPAAAVTSNLIGFEPGQSGCCAAACPK